MTDNDKTIKDSDHQDGRDRVWRKPEISRIGLKRTLLATGAYEDFFLDTFFPPND